ncbi:NACHT, LRR and PYD domains-containing protein 1a [Anabarilius grahami]|uniref:NACHT, LRR and PYD domains-containing protein 1a n=1 Tax=Anabarilius grahami TaxID=495550 RepID=A0A3N0YRH3_ANAGA|nr:NACHT, LRR and PYD domains-containing protein 1a [Anabarilius grahami]
MFLANHRSELIQRVTRVMPIVDELLAQHMLNYQTYARIRRAPTNQEQMTELYKALDEGGYDVKSAFYFALRKYEPHLFCYLGKDLTENKLKVSCAMTMCHIN